MLSPETRQILALLLPTPPDGGDADGLLIRLGDDPDLMDAILSGNVDQSICREICKPYGVPWSVLYRLSWRIYLQTNKVGVFPVVLSYPVA